MKKVVFYGMPGDGLGHACRAQAVLEHLADDVEVHLFSGEETYDYFQKLNYPHLHRISTLPLVRSRDDKIDATRSAAAFLTYFAALSPSIRHVESVARAHRPSLLVSDYEGVLSRAGRKLGRPVLSIDTQHKLSRCELKDLSWRLWLSARAVGFAAEWLCPRPTCAVVSTFYPTAVRKKYRPNTVLAPCCMRRGVEGRPPTPGDEVLVYYKHAVGQKILDTLARTDERVVVYNCPPAERRHPQFTYREVDNDSFIECLANCKAVFCSGGNQLLGEAMYYGKPVFAVPEPNHAEQEINSFYLRKMGHGMTCSLREFDLPTAQTFLKTFVPARTQMGANGVYQIVKQIYKHLAP